jgi:hypothetical protein
MTAWALASRLGASAALAQKTWPGWTAARYPVAVLRDSTATATSGAAIFGAGFGLTGTCPGGAIAMTATGGLGGLLVLAGLAVGMWLRGTIEGPARGQRAEAVAGRREQPSPPRTTEQPPAEGRTCPSRVSRRALAFRSARLPTPEGSAGAPRRIGCPGRRRAVWWGWSFGRLVVG